MKLAVSQELFAYWDRLRGERVAPERNDIDPAALRAVLADVFILEYNAGKGFPLRISGSRSNALFLRELRNTSFLDCWAGEFHQEIAAILRQVADEAQPMILGAKARADTQASLEFEILALPLRYFGDTHARILGAIAPRAAPPWLGLLPMQNLNLTSLRALDRRSGAASLYNAIPNAQQRLFGGARNIVRRGHLYVHSAKREI